MLENVKHLQRHDQGRTFRIIWETPTDHLKYHVHHRVIDAQSLVPQHRERIFLVGFHDRRYFDFPELPREGPKLESILDDEVEPAAKPFNHGWRPMNTDQIAAKELKERKTPLFPFGTL